MVDIFISHVEEDANLALEIAQALEHSGFLAWYYERDTVPGRSYLLQIGDAIDSCHAVILLISSHSLGSYQVRQEVIRAYESNKPFLPLLIDVSHAEFQTRQPEWRAALGAAASLRIPPEGIRPILPQLTRGLATLRIHPGGPRDTAPRREGDSTPEAIPPPAPPQGSTVAPSYESRHAGREDAPQPQDTASASQGVQPSFRVKALPTLGWLTLIALVLAGASYSVLTFFPHGPPMQASVEEKNTTSTFEQGSTSTTKTTESSPPPQPSIVLPEVKTVQDGPRGVDNPFRLELGAPSKATLDRNEVSYFLVSLPAGRFKVVLDTRQFDGNNSNLQSALTITDVDGAVIKDEVIRFNAVDVAWRETYNFSLKQPMKTGFKLTNFRNKANFWLVVLEMPSDEAEIRQNDLRESARKEYSPGMRVLKPPRTFMLKSEAEQRTIELPETDEAIIQHDDLKESDLKGYNPKMVKLVPFPFFGKTIPTLLRLDQTQKGTLNQGESAYYITLLPQGKYKVVVGFDNATRRNTNIQGYLAFLHADGGGQKPVIDFNEVDVSTRKSAEVTCKKASIVVMRIHDNRDTINYSVVIRQAE